MKTIFVLLLIALPFSARSQLELYGKYKPCGSVEPIVNYFAEKIITKKISLTFFGLVQQKWSEALVGIKYAPSNSFNLNGSVGIEDGTNCPRVSASMWKEKRKISFLLLGELGIGKDNYLYKSNLFYKCSEQFTFGATAWRYHGVGPNLRFTLVKLSSTIWLMPSYDFEEHASKLMIGMRVNM